MFNKQFIKNVFYINNKLYFKANTVNDMLIFNEYSTEYQKDILLSQKQIKMNFEVQDCEIEITSNNFLSTMDYDIFEQSRYIFNNYVVYVPVKLAVEV